MKVKFSGIGITGAAGKIGGSVIINQKSGASLQNSNMPAKSRSKAQQNHRVMHQLLSNLWKSLSIAEASSWSAAQIWKGVKTQGKSLENIHGRPLFFSRNTYLYLAELPLLRSYKSPGFTPVNFTSLGIDFRAIGDLRIDWSSDVQSFSLWFLIYVSRCYSAGRTIHKPPYLVLRVLLSAFSRTTDLTSNYESFYGTLGKSGSKIYWKVVAVESPSGLSRIIQSGVSVRP